MALADERCEACTGATPRVTGAELETLHAELHPDWRLEGERLRRSIRTRDFAGAFARATHVALIAEAQGHHPDLQVAWGRLVIEVWTHAVDGLTRSDFVLAARIDAALESR
jgi:4a-hydroxytetrahydrobiopterin dehydratase